MEKKKILIIGAGPSGLVSAKEALDNGMDPIIFEKTENIGGLWNPETGSVWPSMNTNLSKYTCSFSGFPWDEKEDFFPSSLKMYQYLVGYVDHINLMDRIRFNHSVLNISKSKTESGWDVEWVDNQNRKMVDHFPGVIICTGIFSKESIPGFQGLNNFKGKTIHSKNYKDLSISKNEKVLVVGGSLSGEQIASDLANQAKLVIHSFRRKFWILKKFLPIDPSDNDSPVVPLDFVFYNRKFYNSANSGNVTPEESNLKSNTFTSSLCKAQQCVPELQIHETDFTKKFNNTITDHYVDYVLEGKIIPKLGEIHAFGENKVIFESGEEVEIDTIVFCIGFKVHVPFLSKEIKDILKFEQDNQLQPFILFNATLHPELPNLFFVGMYKGPFLPTMELQARLSCRILAGRVGLPSLEIIEKGLEQEWVIRNPGPKRQFPRPDYVKFADQLALLAGSLPDLVKLKELNLRESLSPLATFLPDLDKDRDQIYQKFISTFVFAEHYNLFENPERALAEIDKVLAVIYQISRKHVD